MVSVIIMAGGIGIRLKNNIPKQFIKIYDKEIIDYSIEQFINSRKIDEYIIVSHINWVKHISKRYPN